MLIFNRVQILLINKYSFSNKAILTFPKYTCRRKGSSCTYHWYHLFKDRETNEVFQSWNNSPLSGDCRNRVVTKEATVQTVFITTKWGMWWRVRSFWIQEIQVSRQSWKYRIRYCWEDSLYEWKLWIRLRGYQKSSEQNCWRISQFCWHQWQLKHYST